jgi:inorganic pyrophosphatase
LPTANRVKPISNAAILVGRIVADRFIRQTINVVVGHRFGYLPDYGAQPDTTSPFFDFKKA